MVVIFLSFLLISHLCRSSQTLTSGGLALQGLGRERAPGTASSGDSSLWQSLLFLRALEASCPLPTGPLSDVEQTLEHGNCFWDRQNMRQRSGLTCGAFHPLHLTHFAQILHRHCLAMSTCSNRDLADTEEATHAYRAMNIDRICTSDTCVHYFVRAPRTQTP